MIRNKKIFKLFLPILIISSLISLTSCKYILTFEKLSFKVLAQKGPVSLALCGYYSDENLKLEYEENNNFENAFNSDEYKVIFYDTIKGQKYCDQYQKFEYYGQVVNSNYKIVTTKTWDNTKPFKIIANDEFGGLGYTLKSLERADVSLEEFPSDLYFDVIKGFINKNVEITYTDKNDYEFYQDLLTGKIGKDDEYNAFAISEPFATRLAITKNSDKFNQEYYDYISIEDYDRKNMTCGVSVYAIYSMFYNTDKVVPQTSIFINKDFKNETEVVKNKEVLKNEKAINTLINVLNNSIDKMCIQDATSTKKYLNGIVENFNDLTTEDLCLKQFEKVGISYNEVTKLQAWYRPSTFTDYGRRNELGYQKNVNKLSDEVLNDFYVNCGLK